MTMFNTILVAIDGSETSQRAFDGAVDMAKAENSKLHAAYVVETGLFSSLPADNTVEIMYRVLETEGNTVLEKAKKHASENNIPVITHMKQGHAASEIVTLADKEKADLIVVGSHRPTMTTYLLGSNAKTIVRHAKCSVLVARD